MLNDSPVLDRAFQALSDPVRRRMLARLSRGPASVSELAKPFSISLPAVLQHLKALEESGLVRSEKKGRVRTVRLEPKALSAAESWIAERRAEWEAQLDRFENYLLTLKSNGEENG
jgi:DNA-binding transcriptional ArsR family regulator